MQSAAKEPIEGEAALAVLKGVTELFVAQGKKTVRFELESLRPSDPELLDLLLGRSGKLRAPTLRRGSRLFVGYNQDLLATAF